MTIRQSSLERLGNFKVMIDDATDQILGLVDAQGQERQLVTATTGPGGGVEKFTVSGLRRADGTVAPLVDTGDGWELLNGWHPRQLFEDGSPGDIFDNRSSALLKSVTVPAVSDLAGDGDPVLVRSGLLTPGCASTALNTVQFSEDLASWMVSNATITMDEGVGTVSVASGDGYAHVAVPRILGAMPICAIEIKSVGAARYAFLGPGGSGSWFDLEAKQGILNFNAYAGRVVESTDGYLWCIVEGTAGWGAATSTTMRLYPSNVYPVDPAPTGGNNTVAGGIMMRRAFYAHGLAHPFVPERDYNYTDTTLPTIVTRGNCCVQTVGASAPVRDGLALDFAGGKTMTVVFDEAPGATTTIARAVPGVGAQITTGNVGIEMEIADSDTALVVIGRALTASETVMLRDWLNVRAAVTA